MSNDAVLDPTVHHLFAEDRFNRENSADHGQGKIQQITATIPTMPFLKPRSLSPLRCPPFLEAGTQDLLWLYKSQRKASANEEERGKQGADHEPKQKKNTGEKEKKIQTNRGGTKLRGQKNTEDARRRTSQDQRGWTEGEMKKKKKTRGRTKTRTGDWTRERERDREKKKRRKKQRRAHKQRAFHTK